MGFFVRPLCIQPGTSVALTNKPQVLDPDEKALLITDFVVSLLLITVGVLVILNLKYGVDLGSLSGLGSIGLNAAYAMIIIGGGIVGFDVLKLIIQQVHHINGLHKLANEAIPELIRELEALENERERLSLQQQSNARELHTLQGEVALINRRVLETNQQLEVALPLTRQVPQLKSRIGELDEQNQRLTQENAAIDELKNQIQELERLKLEVEGQNDSLKQELQQARQQTVEPPQVEGGINQISQEQQIQLQEKTQKVEELEKLIAEKTQLLQSAEEQKSTSASKIEELEELHKQATVKAQKVDSLEKEISELKQTLEQAQQLQQQLDEKNQKVGELERLIAEKTQLLERTEEEKNAFCQKFHQLESENKNALEQVDQARQQFQQLKAQKEENQRLESELEALKKSSSKHRKRNQPQKLSSLNDLSIPNLKPTNENPLAENQEKKINEALIFRPSNYVNGVYELNKLDFSLLQIESKRKIHEILNLKTDYEDTIKELLCLRDTLINKARALRGDLSQNHSVKLRALAENAKNLKGYLERINTEAEINYSNIFKN